MKVLATPLPRRRKESFDFDFPSPRQKKKPSQPTSCLRGGPQRGKVSVNCRADQQKEGKKDIRLTRVFRFDVQNAADTNNAWTEREGRGKF